MPWRVTQFQVAVSQAPKWMPSHAFSVQGTHPSTMQGVGLPVQVLKPGDRFDVAVWPIPVSAAPRHQQ